MRRLPAFFSCFLLAGCPGTPPDDGKAPGSEGGPCYGNGTCDQGLTCLSQLCVNAGGPVSSSGSSTSQSGAGSAGSSAVGASSFVPSSGSGAPASSGPPAASSTGAPSSSDGSGASASGDAPSSASLVPASSSAGPSSALPGGGTIHGRACAPDGDTSIPRAQAYLLRNDVLVAQTIAGAGGRFTFNNVAPGTYTVLSTRNSYGGTTQVQVAAGSVNGSPTGPCTVALDVNRAFAVVSGSYDNVRCLLTGPGDPGTGTAGHPCEDAGLGLNPSRVISYDGLATTWADTLLGIPATLAQYDSILLNCGLNVSPFTGPGAAANIAALRAWVQQGNTLYASDWAATVVEQAFPELIGWRNGGMAQPENTESAKLGRGATYTAEIIDLAAQTDFGAPSLAVNFALPQWVVMQSVAPPGRVIVQGDIEVCDGFLCTTFTPQSDAPLTAVIPFGLGKIVFTSFHYEDNTTAASHTFLSQLLYEL